jgi:hypothetical protein
MSSALVWIGIRDARRRRYRRFRVWHGRGWRVLALAGDIARVARRQHGPPGRDVSSPAALRHRGGGAAVPNSAHEADRGNMRGVVHRGGTELRTRRSPWPSRAPLSTVAVSNSAHELRDDVVCRIVHRRRGAGSQLRRYRPAPAVSGRAGHVPTLNAEEPRYIRAPTPHSAASGAASRISPSRRSATRTTAPGSIRIGR